VLLPLAVTAFVVAAGLAGFALARSLGVLIEERTNGEPGTGPARSPTLAPAPTGVASPAAASPGAPTTAAPSPAAASAAPQAVLPPATTARTRPASYTVQPGDSYNGIADRFGVSLDELLRASGRTTQQPLFAGTVLILP
jgi:LysM repeat protein